MTARERSALQDRVSRALLRREQERLRLERIAGDTWVVSGRSPRYRRAARCLLSEPGRSDRSLALQAGVSHTTVRYVRRYLEATGALESAVRRVDRRGTTTCWAARLRAFPKPESGSPLPGLPPGGAAAR